LAGLETTAYDVGRPARQSPSALVEIRGLVVDTADTRLVCADVAEQRLDDVR
jgi:hypothetical protein